MRCRDCEHWEPSDCNRQFLPDDHIGVCKEIEDKIEVTLRTGWDGGYVDYIETNCNFFCAEFNPINKQE